MQKIIYLSLICLIGAFVLSSASAFAQDTGASTIDDACYSLDSNNEWAVLFSEFSEAYSLNDYQTALEKTTKMKAICVRSPKLNFAIAQTYYQIGDKEKALIYIKDATHYTREFDVGDEIARRMWELRHTLEIGDELAERDAEIARLKGELEASNTRNSELNELNNDLGQKNELHKNQLNDSYEMIRDNAQNVWLSGAIIGGVGVVSLATGAGLLATYYFGNTKKAVKNYDAAKKKADIDVGYQAAWSLLGIGIGLTAAGAVMAGIGGYQYTHALSDDVTLSWGVSPMALELSMQF